MSNYKLCLGAGSQEPCPGPSIGYPTHLRDSKRAGGCGVWGGDAWAQQLKPQRCGAQ